MSEKLNELRKATMASYLAKAGKVIRADTSIAASFDDDVYKHMRVANDNHPNVINGKEKSPEKLAHAQQQMKVNADLRDTFKRSASNRIKGIALAGRRLAKEDAEQIDELKKSTLGSYLKKAANRHGVSASHIGALAGAAAVVAPGATLSQDELEDHLGKKMMRQSVTGAKGMSRAIDRLTKEEAIVEAGKNPYGPGYKLIDKDGKQLHVGHKFKDEDGEHHEVTGWQSGAQRGNSSSSGRVAVKVGKGKKAYHTEYFPHVFDMKVVKEDAEQIDEVSRSTIAKVATARYNQAQDALKQKDFGGYVKKMGKAIKAGNATTPVTGWSPEDDNTKRNEEVVPVLSAQEKYRQIKEAKLAKSAKSTTTHHNYYIYHDDLAKSSSALKKAGIPHHVADHSKAPVEHSIISVRYKHTEKADEVLKKNKINYGGR
jgi:hypothetical protein